MRFIQSIGILLLLGLVLTAVGGCYGSADIAFYEPHVYKGTTDPLLGKLQSSGLRQRLQERFRAVQTDR